MFLSLETVIGDGRESLLYFASFATFYIARTLKLTFSQNNDLMFEKLGIKSERYINYPSILCRVLIKLFMNAFVSTKP